MLSTTAITPSAIRVTEVVAAPTTRTRWDYSALQRQRWATPPSTAAVPTARRRIVRSAATPPTNNDNNPSTTTTTEVPAEVPQYSFPVDRRKLLSAALLATGMCLLFAPSAAVAATTSLQLLAVVPLAAAIANTAIVNNSLASDHMLG